MHVEMRQSWEQLNIQVKPTLQDAALSWQGDELKELLAPALAELRELPNATDVQLNNANPTTIVVTFTVPDEAREAKAAARETIQKLLAKE